VLGVELKRRRLSTTKNRKLRKILAPKKRKSWEGRENE